MPYPYLVLIQTSSRLRFIKHLQIANGGTWQLTATHNDIVDRDEHELHRVANEAFVSPSWKCFYQKQPIQQGTYNETQQSHICIICKYDETILHNICIDM